MEKAKVSILVAAYQVEKYIAQTLESACGQTMQEIEIIITDDCSTDSTPAILAEYETRDARIRVLRPERNMGTFGARWLALQNATGEYILFLDGDDCLAPDACSFLYQFAAEHHSEVIQFGTELFGDPSIDLSLPQWADLARYFAPCAADIPERQGAALPYCFCQNVPFAETKFPWNLGNKFFQRELLCRALAQYNGERLCMGEDALTTFMALAHAQRVHAVQNVFLRYRVGSGISTAQEQTLSPSRIPTIVSQCLVDNLLHKWIRGTGLPEDAYAAPMAAAHEMLYQNVFAKFLIECRLQDASLYWNELQKYLGTREIISRIVQYTFQAKLCRPEHTAQLLRYALPTATDPKPIHTVGMFHFQLYNGGIERVVANLVPVLQKQGYRVVLFTNQKPHPDDYPLPPDVQRVVLPSAEEDPVARAEAWQQGIQAHTVDAMVFHPWISLDVVLDSLAIKATGIPLLRYAHSCASSIFRYAMWECLQQDEKYALFDTILTLSEVDNAWWTALGFRAIQVVNPLTYLPSAYPVADFAQNRHTAVWVGRLSEEKQCFHAFQIAKLVHDRIPDFRLRVVGSTSDLAYAEKIRRYLTEHDLTSIVFLEGFHTDVLPYYKNAAVLLSTSMFEGAPMVFYEGKTFGLPLVSYELSNLDIIRDNSSGTIVVPQGDIEAAADALVRLLTDDTLHQTLSQQSRAYVEKIEQLDLGALWQSILEQSKITRPLPLPLYQRNSPDVAFAMTLQSIHEGILRGGSTSPYTRDLEVQNAAYAIMVKELRQSTSYRLGQLLLWPLRMLKKLLRH